MAKSLIGAVALLCASLALSAPVHADEFGIHPGSFRTDLTTNQAGAHPDLRTRFEVNVDSENHPVGGTVKDLKVDLPKGLVGAATATPTCPINMVSDFEHPCPLSTAVGKVTATTSFPDSNTRGIYRALVYNVSPAADEPAALAFKVIFAAVRLDIRIRSDGDYAITASASNLSEASYLLAADLTLWGVPADHNGPGPETEAQERSFGGPGSGARLPFLTNPTECSANPLTSTLTMDSWQHPGVFTGAGFGFDPITGCDRLSFGPNLDLRPDARVAGAPTGFAVDLAVPQSTDPSGLATPNVKDIEVRLPAGVALSPAIADGLASCSDDQVGLSSSADPRCPRASTIAAVTVQTPLLADPLQGAIYLGTQLSDDPLSGRMLRLFLVAQGPGTTIKLPGSVVVDPDNGRLAVSFTNTPQLPFEDVRLAFNGGPRAALTMPSACATYTTQAEITPWSSAVPTRSSSSFTIDRNCAQAAEFTPSLEAGVSNPVAGKSSPFTVEVSREDGQQNIATMQAGLPEGELARLAGIPLCADAQAATGNCDPSSRIGTVVVAAGSGPSPLYVPQPGRPPAGVYLAGPYRGAPYSIVVKIPAQAGPLDLGTVAVRMALKFDSKTARVTVASDPLPQILRGVPFSYRTVYLRLDRPGLMRNPTSCDPMRVTSTLTSAAGQKASPSDHFQVADCERLGFKPKLALSLSGPTHRSAFPKLKMTLRARRGDANIRSLALTLPETEFLGSSHIRSICNRTRYEAGDCPARSIYGYAKAWSPLLDRPLAGPVYLRSSNRELPDLVASLDGQIQLDLNGRLDSVKARVRNTFEALPDVPLSKFVLTMRGGRNGLLVNNTNLCKAVPRAGVVLRGQNGKVHRANPIAKADCG